MGPVLLGLAWLDALVIDVELDPPYRQTRQTAEGSCGEGSTVVGADGLRQAVVVEEALEVPKGRVLLNRGQALAGQYVARVRVADRQRIAVASVAGFELPLVVSRPNLVGGRGRQRCGAGVLGRSSLSACSGQAVAFEDGPGGRGCRELDVGVAPCEVGQQLLGSPTRVGSAGLDDQGLDLRRCLVGLAVGCMAAVSEGLSSPVSVSLDPGVDGGPGDAEASGQFSDGEEAVLVE